MLVLVVIAGVLAIETLTLLVLAYPNICLHSYLYDGDKWECRKCGHSFSSFMD